MKLSRIVRFYLLDLRAATRPPKASHLKESQSLPVKMLCFGFLSTNHIARNHIEKIVYGRTGFVDTVYL